MQFNVENMQHQAHYTEQQIFTVHVNNIQINTGSQIIFQPLTTQHHHKFTNTDNNIATQEVGASLDPSMVHNFSVNSDAIKDTYSIVGLSNYQFFNPIFPNIYKTIKPFLTD
jgi:hypothetical protein